MARITRSRARSPLAEGMISPGWSRFDGKEEISLTMYAAKDTSQREATFIALKLDMAETQRLAVYFAQQLTKKFGEYGQHETLKGPQALRALADLIEEGK